MCLTAGCATPIKKAPAEAEPPALTNKELEDWNWRLQKELDGLKQVVAALRGEYLLARGDTLAKVAKKVGVSIEELLRLNPNVDPTHLKVGQALKIK